jgi:hypothetical protein
MRREDEKAQINDGNYLTVAGRHDVSNGSTNEFKTR